MPLQVQQNDCCAAPGGTGECFYTGCCLPCSLGALVTDIVAADPSAIGLHGCTGNACTSFCLYMTIPYVGGIVATTTMIPPVYAKVAGPMEPPLPCCTALCCAACVVCQLKNEVALRRAQGVPIVPQGMPMVMMQPGMVMQQPGMAYTQPQMVMQQNQFAKPQ